MSSIFIRKCSSYVSRIRLMKHNYYWSSYHTTCVRYNGAILPFKLSDIGEGIREVVVKEWFVKEGQQISQFDNICEVQSDKASVTITSRYDGVVHKICHRVDDIVLVGDTLIQINTNTAIEDAESEQILAIPAVRKLAKDQNIDLNGIKGSGKDGRVVKEDLIKSPSTGTSGSIPISGYRKAMFKTMTESLKIPHFAYSDEINMTSLIKVRGSIKNDAKSAKITTLDPNVVDRLTFMPFMIKAASLALHEYPILNSQISACETRIEVHASHNIGVAMDTAAGLVVPHIKDVQRKSIVDVTTELIRLQQCGASGAFDKNDLTGGTFVLSNIGIVGGTYAKPIILHPNVAIGAVGKVQMLPRFNAREEVVAAHVMQVSWSADHRVIDGVTMARFSNLWKHYLEHPHLLLLNVQYITNT